MNPHSRFQGCLLGVAVGDAVGSQIRSAGDVLHTPLIADAALRVSSRTSETLIGARAAALARARGDGGAYLGPQIAAELARWYHEPGAALTGPSPTTRASAAAMVAGCAWNVVSNPQSCGSDVLLRAVPMGLAYGAEIAPDRGRLAAGVTHGHPTVDGAAAAVAYVIARLTRGAWLGRPLFDEAARICRNDQVRESLTAAIVAAEARADRPRQWIRCDDVPGDCGLSAASAVGLAVEVALCFPGVGTYEDFEAAVELAARIPGRGDVVAALVGGMLGAAWGHGAVSRHFIERIPAALELSRLARGLHAMSGASAYSAGPAPRDADVDGAWSPGMTSVEDFRAAPVEDVIAESAVGQRLVALKKILNPDAYAAADAEAEKVEPKWVIEGEVDLHAMLEFSRGRFTDS